MAAGSVASGRFSPRSRRPSGCCPLGGPTLPYEFGILQSVVDNALWGGEVLNSTYRERNVMAIRELTRMLTEDPGWISTIVPIRDGLLMAFRQSEMPAEVR